jgi:ribonucleoside-diphosphate reductase alpha chain
MSHIQKTQEIKDNSLYSNDNNIRPVTQRFKLSKETCEEIRRGTPRFGFNGLGEVVFRRTYSRNNETWHDVVIRVIEGVMSIRKEHFYRHSLRWNDADWQPFAKEMALSLFKMEWLPPGRGLWMMGTDFTYSRGAMALNNCAATDTKNDIVLSAEWTMDGLMNGVGVGFTTYWRGEAKSPNKEDTEVFVIPDSREGWCQSLVKLMCAYIHSPRYGSNKFPTFDYSAIRKKGEPIRGFGGQASGPGPLQKMHQRIEGFLDSFCDGYILSSNGKRKRYNHTRLVADIFNSIGACVVAGNVRRSAEICLGDVEDETFINLKNYEENPERGEIG